MTGFQTKDWKISPESDGFQRDIDTLGGIAKYLCIKNDQVVGFAFWVSLFDRSVNPRLTDVQLVEMADQKIKEYLSEKQIKNREEYTFVYQNGEFIERPDATWWNKTL